MRDAEGSNSRAPISRISRHEDTNGDGTYDKHTVFVDNMVMPRIAFPLGDGVILALETDNRDMYKYTDTNGDGVSDKKELFYPGVGRVTNMEWQPGGLTWAMDNWLYMTYNPFRLRIAPDGKVLREETDSNGGQWWSAQDNYGKMWWVDGGGEIGPVNIPGADRLRRAQRQGQLRARLPECPGRRRAASPTCRAGCAASACPMAR